MERLFIIIATTDKLVQAEMCLMYATNALKKQWMDQVRVIFWGPSQLTLIKEKDIQEKVKEFQALGGEAWACKRCSEDLGVVDPLERLGIKMDYVGALLTSMLKEGWHQLTF